MFGKLPRAMARNDLRQDFVLHKAHGPIACGTLVVREKFFDLVVVERIHSTSLTRGILAVGRPELNGPAAVGKSFHLYEVNPWRHYLWRCASDFIVHV